MFDDEYRRVVGCGWCMNLANNAVTRYEGWDITSASGDYVTTVDGIYTLADGDNVELKQPILKRVGGIDFLSRRGLHKALACAQVVWAKF